MKDYHTRLLQKQFGKLTVVSFVGVDKKKRTIWKCKCECGKEKIVRNDGLIQGKTQSCGCLNARFGPKHHSWTGYNEISGSFWKRIQRDAKSRDLECSITIEDIWDLFLKQNRKCALTGEVLTFGKTKMDTARTASLDRIDSSKGYFLGNVQWVHKDVNFAKQDLSQQDFILLCQKVVNHMRRSPN